MNILCFGDSNTYGTSPVDGKRFAADERWPSLLGIKLGAGYQVIEAGQPNRTLVNDPPFSGDKLGIKYLEPYLAAYHLDVIIIQLGTNDLKRRFALSVADIAKALEALISNIKKYYLHRDLPKIIILSAPRVYEVGAYQSIYAGHINLFFGVISIYLFELIILYGYILYYTAHCVMSLIQIVELLIRSESRDSHIWQSFGI